MVIVDSRIGSVGFADQLKQYGLTVKVDALSFGDFAFTGNGATGACLVGIERKTVNEMVSDFDRFVGHQLPGLASTYTHYILIVEGMYRPDPQGRVEVFQWNHWKFIGHAAGYNYQEFTNKLNTLRLKCGLTMIHTTAEVHTASEVHALYHWFQRPWDNHKSHQVVHRNVPYATTTGASVKMKVFTSFPGLGGERAVAAMKYFATIRDMVNAPVEEWLKIDGIGRKTAEKIIKEIT
jgi:ERCC4-type nuclease